MKTEMRGHVEMKVGAGLSTKLMTTVPVNKEVENISTIKGRCKQSAFEYLGSLSIFLRCTYEYWNDLSKLESNEKSRALAT
jgi:hypothetical protein